MRCAACRKIKDLKEYNLLCCLYCKECRIDVVATNIVEELKKLKEYQI